MRRSGAGHACAVQIRVGMLGLGWALAGCVQIAEVSPCTPAAPAAPAADLTWHRDIRPMIEARCAPCHSPGNIGPLPLRTYEEVAAVKEAVAAAVLAGRMPPWQPASCCNQFRDDMSLDATEVANLEAWVQRGAPQGDPSEYPGPQPTTGGLSRADVQLRMPEPYTARPEAGHFDDYRCFALDWPLDAPAFVTGLNPLPGARDAVHHIVLAYAEGDDAKWWDEQDAGDGRPGVPCEGGLGDVRFTGILGGSLLGGDFPPGIGTRIEPGAKIIMDVHYSLSAADEIVDQTGVQMMVEPEGAALQPTQTLIIANPLWLLSDGMRIEAGAKSQRFRYQYDPRGYTKAKPVLLHGFTPHMHAFGRSMVASIVRKDGKIDCLTDIQDWDFGWEQPLWFAEPIRLDVGDELYISCTFDNSADNQPIIDGRRIEPRDIAWGTDQQDMCVGFLSFTQVPES